uniref:uncharacterized protein LOC120344876 isoform X2 n=1 Tax=Styela clava TaxID=7725 RepID=UPI00193A562F|nr:uncharacterized protein LOC120344876 isoform X2 [Styela clava]
MNLLLIACFCLMVAYTGNAAKCYTCSNCSDEKLSSSQLVNCSVSQTTCVKETKSNGAVNRYCTSPRESGCKQKGSGEFATDICFCNEDGCNGIDSYSSAAATTTSIIEPNTSSAATIKSSFLIGFFISLIVATFMVV